MNNNNNEFVPAGHYYSPIPDIEYIKSKKDLLFNTTIRDIPGIDMNDDTQKTWFKNMATFYDGIPFQENKTSSLRYYFENGSYEYNDAIMLYTFIRELKPKKIIEVGSGFSSAVMLDTIDLYPDNKAQITFIEPFPDVLNKLLLSQDRTIHQQEQIIAQDAPIELFKTLHENDILFIDSTHVSKIGSDVNYLFFEILPILNPGVYVHIHDIFYPFEYPEQWVLGEKRFWNEDYLIRAFLTFNDTYEIVFFNDYFSKKYRNMYSETPLCLMNPGGGLWLRRKK